MDSAEIDSFVKKFKILWGAGYDASLNLESKLGEVFISLNCKVGRVLPPPSPSGSAPLSSVVQKSRKPRGPSYHRRQARRKASRDSILQPPVAEQANVEVNTNMSEPILNSEVAEEAINDEVDDKDITVVESADVVQDDTEVESSEDEEDDEETTDSTEIELSHDVGEQLRSLIEESKEKRESWARSRCSDGNG